MYINEFITYIQKVRRYSPRTVKSYSFNLNAFAEYLNAQGVAAPAVRDVARYVEYLMVRGLHPASVNQHLASIRSYYDYACRFEGEAVNPAAGVREVRKPSRLPLFITADKMNFLIDHLLPCSDFKRMRTRIIILLFYHTGVRCSELASLRDAGVNLSRDYIKVYGKGDKERIIPFGRELHNEITRYLQMRDTVCPCDRSDYFIKTSFGTNCTPGQIRVITKMALRRVVPEEYCHPHVLRHTFATHLMNNGARIENIKLLLGHESITTTAIYEHTSISHLKNIYNLAFGR